jgi:hypothetical protein
MPDFKLKELEHNVDPMLANTRLAYHLKDLATTYKGSHVGRLAEKALKGEWGAPNTGTDPFTELGTQLTNGGHQLGKAYNWNKIHEALVVDNAVRDYIHNRVKGNFGNNLFRKVAESYANVAGRKAANHEDFWTGLRQHLQTKLGKDSLYGMDKSNLTDEKLFRSLRRQAYREADQEDIATNKSKADKKVKGGGVSLPAKRNLSQLPADKKHVEAYSKHKDDYILKYMAKLSEEPCCDYHTDFIQDCQEKGMDMEGIKEALQHEFHLSPSEASKAMLVYASPTFNAKNSQYPKDLSDSMSGVAE